MNLNQTPEVLRPFSTMEGIHPLIAGRWSSRAIDPEADVDPETLFRLFEAARWAPSAVNNQPWRFLSFGPEDPEALSQARTALKPGNAWALAAPRLLFVLARRTRPGTDKQNRLALYETGMAVAAMACQAAHEGLVFHQMAGFDDGIFRRRFLFPSFFEVLTAVAIGRPGRIGDVPEDKRGGEAAVRERVPLDRLVFSNGRVPQE